MFKNNVNGNKLGLYAIMDEKAEAFGQPFICPTDGVAVRSFMEASVDKNSNIALYPSDFALFKVGEFDITNGEIKKEKTALLTAVEAQAGAKQNRVFDEEQIEMEIAQ